MNLLCTISSDSISIFNQILKSLGFRNGTTSLTFQQNSGFVPEVWNNEVCELERKFLLSTGPKYWPRLEDVVDVCVWMGVRKY